MEKVAILIPAFNSSNTIRETLDSVQSQLSKFSSQILVYLADDCSNDDTIKIALDEWKSVPNISVISNHQNLGERGNVNRAVDEILKTEVTWLIILHSDDIAKPNWLDLILSEIEICDENIGSICSSYDNLMPDGSVMIGEDNLQRPIEIIRGDSLSVKGTLMNGCWWHISGCAIRLKTFQEIGGFLLDMPQQGDWEWLLRCLSKGWNVKYIPRTLISYRQHQASVSSVSYRSHRDILESLKILRQYSSYLLPREYLKLHLIKASYLFRRMVRSIVELDIKRFLLAWKVLFILIGNIFYLPELHKK